MGRIYVSCLELSKSQCFYINDKVPPTISCICEHFFHRNDVPNELQHLIYFTKQGLQAKYQDIVSAGDTIYAHFRMKGGKGGFGSMLRAIGSQIEKTTNMEACRDLSGRRMRDVNNEKKMVEWVKQKAEKDRLKEKEKIEKLERQLQKPKHFFNDPDYEKKLESTADSVEEALKKGLAAHKRKATQDKSSSNASSAKKKKLWMGDDLSDSSDSDSSDDCFVPAKKNVSNLEEGTSSSGSNSATSNDKSTDHGNEAGHDSD